MDRDTGTAPVRPPSPVTPGDSAFGVACHRHGTTWTASHQLSTLSAPPAAAGRATAAATSCGDRAASSPISQRLVGHRLVVLSSGALSFGRMDGHVTLVVPAGMRLVLHSSGGSVQVVGSTGRVSASSSGGSVRLDFAVDPTRVDGRSSAGSVLVQVPRDKMVYVVDAGSVRVSYLPAG